MKIKKVYLNPQILEHKYWTEQVLLSSIVSWTTLALSKEQKCHILGQYWYEPFQYLGPKIYLFHKKLHTAVKAWKDKAKKNKCYVSKLVTNWKTWPKRGFF